MLPARKARYLENSIRFDQNFILSPAKKIIGDDLLDNLINWQGKRYKKQKKIDFEVICANLLRKEQKQPLSISLDDGVWKSGRRWRTSHFILEGIKLLYAKGFIEMKKGFQFKRKARQTRIWPTKKLTDLFYPVEISDVRFSPADLVNLHDKQGRLIDYIDTKETKRVRDILRKANLVNGQALVQEIPINRAGMACKLETNLHAVYNCDFKHGGRLYTGTEYGYQSLSEDERKTILVDNKKTIELDFSGLHPRILYAWEGIQYDGDPYAIIPDAPEMRQIIKKVFLALLNAKDEITAIRAGNKFLYDNRKYYNFMRKQGLKIKDDLIPMFKEIHAPISHYFCKSTGLKVMNFDAKIALEIIKHFAGKRIPILAIHDSFIVFKYLKDELKEVMQSSYKRLTKGFDCPVK